jgi:hypothetical protein
MKEARCANDETARRSKIGASRPYREEGVQRGPHSGGVREQKCAE